MEIKTFEDLLKTEDDDLQSLIHDAKILKIKQINQEITESEFNDLFNDLISLKNIEDDSKRIIIVKKIDTIIHIIEKLRSWAP